MLSLSLLDSSGTNVTRKVDLPDSGLLIGRRDGDLLFELDPYLDDRHVRITPEADAALIEDLSRRNGVFVEVEREGIELKDGAQVQIGRQVLRFTTEHGESAETSNSADVRPFGGPVRQGCWGCVTLLMDGGGEGDRFYLYTTPLGVGRETADIPLPATDELVVELLHASLSLEEGNVKLYPMAHLSSDPEMGYDTGTYLRIRQPTHIRRGMRLRAGSLWLRVE